MKFQQDNGLAADGMAGPTTLSKLSSFQTTYNADVLKKAEIKPDEEHFEFEPFPEFPEVTGFNKPREKVADADPAAFEPVVGGASEAAPAKSLWSKVTGWFS